MWFPTIAYDVQYTFPLTGTYDYNSGKIDFRKIAFGKYGHLLVWRLSVFELQPDTRDTFSITFSFFYLV